MLIYSRVNKRAWKEAPESPKSLKTLAKNKKSTYDMLAQSPKNWRKISTKQMTIE